MHAPPASQSTDQQLLRQYADQADQRAFTTLVQRHIRLVYSAAQRRLARRDLAEDVSQVVFILLARKAKSVSREAVVSRWLLSTVRYVAANLAKTEGRRQRREQIVAMQQPELSKASADPSEIIVWQEAATMLDDAVLNLRASDRDVLLLRYFQEQPIAQIAATLQTTEGAVKQRLSRAIDHLRRRLARRDVVAAMLGAEQFVRLLQAHAVKSAPQGLAAAAASAAFHGAQSATVISLSQGAIRMMRWTQIKLATAVAAALIIGGAGGVIELHRAAAAGAASKLSLASATHPLQTAAAPRSTTKPAATIRIGDELIFHVDYGGSADDDFEQHVDTTGTIMFPAMGWITAAGQTPAQVADDFKRHLAKWNYPEKSTVTIDVHAAPPKSDAGLIHVGDALRIRIWGLPGLGNVNVERAFDANVDPDGTVEVPLIGSIRLAGDTEQRAITAISKAYEDAQMMMDMPVSVLRIGEAAAAQGGPAASQPAPQPPVVLRSGDEVRAYLWDLYGDPGYCSCLQDFIDGDGTMTFPLVGPIKLAGLTEWQAMQKIAQVFSDKQILTNMQDTLQRIVAAPPSASTSQPEPQPPVVLRSGDRVSVELVGVYKPLDDIFVQDRIAADGNVNFPRIGPINLADLTKWQAMQRITKAYADKRNAIVTSWLQLVPPGDPFPSTQPPPAAGELHAPATASGAINIGDKLIVHLRIGRGEGIDCEQHVGPDGTIVFPFYGPFAAAGQTPADVAADIQSSWADWKPQLKSTASADVQPAMPGAGDIHVGDAVRICIWGLDGLEAVPRSPWVIDANVQQDGTVELPMIGPIRLAGDNEQQAIARIAKAFADPQIITNLPVTVLRVSGETVAASDQHPALQPPVVLRIGDEVRVILWDLYGRGSEDLLQDRIDNDGTMTFPMVGPIKLAGLTEWQAMQKITQVYGDRQIMVHLANTVQRMVAAPPAPSSQPANGSPSLLRSGDRIRVLLNGVYKTDSQTMLDNRITADGTVNFPLVGPIKLVGLTRWQAMQKIAKVYRDQQIVMNMQDLVAIVWDDARFPSTQPVIPAPPTNIFFKDFP